MFFNLVLRLLLEGYLEYAIDALINIEEVRSIIVKPYARLLA